MDFQKASVQEAFRRGSGFGFELNHRPRICKWILSSPHP